MSSCLKENYADCLLAYSGLIGKDGGKRNGGTFGGLQIPEVGSVHAHLPLLRQLEFPLQSILKLDPKESFCTKEKRSQVVFTGC